MQHTLHRLLKGLGCLALACYVVLGVAFLGMRYWVLPNIDQWREPLQRELSTLLSVEVQLGHVAAEWRGLHPRITVRDARLRDAAGRSLLDIPSLDAVVAWQSLFTGRPGFVGLRADGVKLSIRRDATGRVSILGQEIDALPNEAATGSRSDAAILRWLSQQGPVRFTNASIRWIDRQRHARPLALHDVSLGLGVEEGEQVFSLQAKPPEALGKSFTLQGRVRLPLQADTLSLEHLSGMVHVAVEGMQPAAWQPWLDVHSVLDGGEVSWRGWQQVADGVPQHHVSVVSVRDGVWRAAQGSEVRAASAQLYLAGPWAAFDQLWSASDTADAAASGAAGAGINKEMNPAAPPPVRVALRMNGLAVAVPEAFEAPLHFDDIAVTTHIAQSAADGVRLDIDRAQLRNADMDLDIHGNWRQSGGGQAGLADLQGHFHRVELAAIVRYLPSVVGDDAREWMHHGLLAGRLTEAQVRLQGDLVHFPFGDRPDLGDFYIGGPVQGVAIDYAPAAVVGEPGWPGLEGLQGHAQLHRVDLKVRAEHMQMRPGDDRIDLREVHAHIANIEQDSVLEIQGKGRAPAAAYLSLIRHSPLTRLLDGVFDEAKGAGMWDVPISMTIPLFDTDETTVAGDVVFNDAALSLSDRFPALSALNGRVSFTETFMSSDGLRGQVLGGPVSIAGGVGGDQKGLVFEGRVAAASLTDYVGDAAKGVLGGAAPYRLALQRNDAGGYGVRVDSSLEGLSIDLPEPIGKPARQRRPLRVQWTPASGKGDAVLDVRLSEQIIARFLHRESRSRASFFHSGVVKTAGPIGPISEGLKVDLQVHRLDIDAWRALGDRQADAASAAGSPFLPPLRDLRLQTEHARLLGTELDQLTFTARRPDGPRWRVDISSTETAGTLFLQERQGRLEGDVEAHFERLSLGRPASETDQDATAGSELDSFPGQDDEVRIPAVRLKVDRLRLYGHELGSVSVVGVNQSQGRVWKLDQLTLTSPHGNLKGTGVWRLAGPQRGLSLQADAAFDDLGAWLDHAGYANLMEGGRGEVSGNIEWRDIPWRFERAALQGDISIDLAKGRLLTVGSRSARLLEVLSLQSVKRLATLEWNPAGLLRQGFPFDTLQGHVKMNDGVMHSENYRVAGPVGTVVIAGDVDLPKERLDLYAVVVPSFDVSGAAIAAGIAVNPIVGLGAFLTQWLLKDPLGKAMAVEYRVKGSFDDPKVDMVGAAPEKAGNER